MKTYSQLRFFPSFFDFCFLTHSLSVATDLNYKMSPSLMELALPLVKLETGGLGQQGEGMGGTDDPPPISE